jgi:hypothetical protein
MRAHIRAAHPDYITPGWPALEGVHGAWPTEGQCPLPSQAMAEMLNYGDSEERRLGLAESMEKWPFIKEELADLELGTKRLRDVEPPDVQHHSQDRKRVKLA